ncbi:hypothetical protein HCJ52_13785 [Listeria sp. FSL L7-1485]|uniref:Uncharacterized protein n=1 Tax=Listeria immobilis TaxID=2713502 RepID=A0ABR6SZU8_9LIST|nr:hypothetical protein [Listeria immobilis]MBC1483968.1 hypothetical protein [Listeria immobilis]MBC1508187.1 hypothetical protein [Listeria immobilis]MBC1511203.1 hypothetical protein [Listeria immobilis]MBC1537188.1 hypothetical protein [Listeria immobilis]MBC6304270.1 hypothetical protein [Listeria immobilis]
MLSYPQQIYIIDVKIYQNNQKQQKVKAHLKLLQQTKVKSDQLNRSVNNVFAEMGEMYSNFPFRDFAEIGQGMKELAQRDKGYKDVEKAFREEIQDLYDQMAYLEQKEDDYFQVRAKLKQQQ